MGQHVLLGALAGLAVSLLIHLELHFTSPPLEPSWQGVAPLAGVVATLAAHLEVLREALRVPIFILMGLLVPRC